MQPHVNKNAANPRTPRVDGTKLQLGHLNIYHLCNKIPDLSVFFKQSSRFHIFGLSETRLNSKVDDSMLSIDNYSILRKDACSPLHTGLAVYVHDSIAEFVTRRLDLESDIVECMWLEIRVPKSPPLLIAFIYRNPASQTSWYDSFITMLDDVPRHFANLYLLGDFNIDLLKEKNVTWDSVVSLFGLHQMVKTPTRTTTTSSTLIDHIYTTTPDLVESVNVPCLSVSDHFPVCCKMSTKVPKQKQKQHAYILYRSMKNFDKESFCHDLQLTPFHHVYDFSDPDKALSCWYNLFLPILNKHAPLREKRVKHTNSLPWITQDIIKAMSHRDKLKTEGKCEEYKKQRNHVTYLIRSAKKAYFNGMVGENKDTVSIWRAINLFCRGDKTTSVSPQLSPDCFNQHFLSIAKNLVQGQTTKTKYKRSATLQQFCKSKLNSVSNSLKIFTIPDLSVAEVGKLIQGVSNKKSSGLDGITSHILKLSLPYIVESLTYIYNICISKGIFPQDLKHAKIIPIPKSKDLTDLNNFRPISILSVISKPLERHIHIHLLKFLEEHDLIYHHQSGFRPKHSCQSALTRLTDTWLSAINENKMTGVVFLDLKKAFDLVDHNILLDKLGLYNLDCNVLCFFESYLQDRKQYVFHNGNYSTEGTISYGVPQGSILGPLLFLLYINDLPLHISNPQVQCDLLADDTTLHTSDKDEKVISKTLQKSLDEVLEWCVVNNMIIHPAKTKSMLITTRQKHQLCPHPLNLSLQLEPIEQVKQHRLLGVIIDNQFAWNPHIENLCKRIAKNIFLLSRLEHITDTFARTLFFHAHIKSHVDFASNIWDGCADVYLKKLDSLYRRAVKKILPGPIPTSEKFRKLNILPLSDRLLFNKTVLMYNILYKNAPQYLQAFFTNERPNPRSARNHLLLMPLPRIDLYKSSLSFSGASAWNRLPSELKLSTSIKVFKHAFTKYIQNVNSQSL